MAFFPDLQAAGEQPTTKWTTLAALDGPNAETAWRTFMQRYQPFVHTILQRKVTRPDFLRAAEEEFWGYVFLSGAVPRAERGRRFRPYLSGIVHNFAQSWLRKHAERAHASVSHLPATPSPVEDLDLPLWGANVLALALDALAKESVPTAQALRGFYGIGLQATSEPEPPQTASQLASALSTSLAAVYQLLSRGRRRLRVLVEAELMAGCASKADLDEEWQILLHSISLRHPGLLDAI